MVTGEFNFATADTQTWKNCTSGCTVNLPAVSGRILYFVVDRNVGGNITSGPLESIAIQ